MRASNDSGRPTSARGGLRFSLSPDERAGVRGKHEHLLPTANNP